MEIDRKETAILVSLFAVSIAVGFFLAGLSSDSGGPEPFEQFVNHTVDSSENTREVKFDNRSLDLMYEDSDEARMYIDLDQDGSFDREINTTNDGEERLTEEIVTLKNRSYRLYFRYMDDRDRSEDGYLTLYRIRQIL